MTDRQPGAPGQYILYIDPSVAQNILIGEPVAVTLTRDDQPIVEGTPYNKATVLPDDLANKICPTKENPTPADALDGLHGEKTQVILFSGNWSDRTQRVAVSGVTADNTVNVGPDTSDNSNTLSYTRHGVRCMTQSDGYLTFRCISVPTVDLVISVRVRP